MMVRLFSRDAVAKFPCTCGSLPGIYTRDAAHRGVLSILSRAERTYFALLKTIGPLQKRTAVTKEDARKSNSFLRGVVVCVVATKGGSTMNDYMKSLQRRGQHSKTKGRTLGGPVHSRSRSRNRQGHHQKCPRQDAGRMQGKTECRAGIGQGY